MNEKKWLLDPASLFVIFVNFVGDPFLTIRVFSRDSRVPYLLAKLFWPSGVSSVLF
jgi:hypothetical protein